MLLELGDVVCRINRIIPIMQLLLIPIIHLLLINNMRNVADNET